MPSCLRNCSRSCVSIGNATDLASGFSQPSQERPLEPRGGLAYLPLSEEKSRAQQGPWDSQPSCLLRHTSFGGGCGLALDPVFDGAHSASFHPALLEATATERRLCRESSRQAPVIDGLSHANMAACQLLEAALNWLISFAPMASPIAATSRCRFLTSKSSRPWSAAAQRPWVATSRIPQ